MTLPASIAYGQVTWSAVSAVADGIDADGNPDAVPVTGTLTFTPSATVLLATAAKVTVIATPVTYTLDSSGVLRDSQGHTGVTLVATDSPGITPTGWTWTVAYKLNNGLARGSFSFALPSGATVDLTTVAPVSSSNGAAIIQGPQGDPGPAGPGVPTGGTSGQVLAKASATDYDTDWVNQASGGADATATTKGVVQLAGDLSGTAAAPTVPGLAAKANTASLATVATTGSYTDLTNKPTIPAAYTDEQAQDAVAAAFAAGTQTGITVTYNDTANSLSLTATGTTSPDATTTSKGIVELAGDLGGTAAAPTVTGGTHHGHTASQISDSSTVGRSVLTAADATTARTAIGAGTSSLALGTTSTTAKAGDYQPAAANISDSTATGRSVLTAADAPTALAAIGAMPDSYAPTLGDIPATTVISVVQNGDGTWPNRPSSRTNLRCMWIMVVAGSADPALATSPAVGGMYSGDVVVRV